MKTDPADTLLVDLLATIAAWHTAKLHPDTLARSGARGAMHNYRRSGLIAWHPTGGARRELEATLRELTAAGLVTSGGSTQARSCGLTWAGVCRATCLTVGKAEIVAGFRLLALIDRLSRQAGGPDVPPSGEVPDYLLDPAIGRSWKNCGTRAGTVALARVLCRLEPAIVMRWVEVTTDTYGRRYYSLTDEGSEAVQHPPAIPTAGAENPELTDHYLATFDTEHRRAECASGGGNLVPRRLPGSQWWNPRKITTPAGTTGKPAGPRQHARKDDRP